jgi:protein gp37
VSAVSSIEWTDRTWNPVRGCRRVSPGCEHCYAEKVAHRFSKLVNGKPGPYFGLTVLGKQGVRWSGEARFIPEALAEPLSWRKPQRVFVNSMSDLFHEDVTNEQIAAVFGVMAACPHLTFQVLTKRPARMLAWLSEYEDSFMQLAGAADAAISKVQGMTPQMAGRLYGHFDDEMGDTDRSWPLRNVWLGVSTEDQQRADERIPLLLQCPAAMRWVSAEPLLGPVNFTRVPCRGGTLNALTGEWMSADRAVREGGRAEPRLGWVVTGGESGPGAREHNVNWSHGIVEQCIANRVAVFQKQLGAHVTDRNDVGFDGGADDRWPAGTEADFDSGDRMQGALVRIRLKNRKGNEPGEWPSELRIRQFPKAVSP